MFIKEHVKDFKAGVDSEYVDNIDIGCSKRIIQRLLQRICEVKRKEYKPDGSDKRKFTRIYKLKECWLINYEDPNDVEEDINEDIKNEEYIDINGRLYKELKVNNKYVISIDSPYIIRSKKTLREVDLWYDIFTGEYTVKLGGKEYGYKDLI